MPIVEVHDKVNICKPLLGKVMLIGLVDFDLQNETTLFLELQFHNYADVRAPLPERSEDMIPKPWCSILLYKANLMNLLDVPSPLLPYTSYINMCQIFS